MFPSTRQGFQFEPFVAESIPGLELPTSVNWRLFCHRFMALVLWRGVESILAQQQELELESHAQYTRWTFIKVCWSVAEKVGISVPCPTCALCIGPSRGWTFDFPTGASGWVSEPTLGASMLSDLEGGTQADSTCTVLLGACQHLAGQTQGFNPCLLSTFLGRPTSIT